MIRPWFSRRLEPPESRYERVAPGLVVLALVLVACFCTAPAVREQTRSAVAQVVPALRASRAAEVPVIYDFAAPPAAAPATEPPAAPWDDPRLVSVIERALAPYHGSYSVVVTRLADGRSASYRADEVYYAASTFKLAVLYEAERRISAGALSPDARLLLTDADYAEDLGTAASLPVQADGTLSMDEALFAMITRSDNTTAVALLHTFGAAKIDATLAELGLQHTSVNTEDLPTTAADMALLMRALLTGDDLTEDARAQARTLLLGQETRSGIPSLLPPDTQVGDKTGTWPGATHDVAFVDAPGGTYILAVLTDGNWEWQPIADVSLAVYNAMSARGGD